MLHRSLKKLVREVIRCDDPVIQKKHLGKVFVWFMMKLESCGMVSSSEKNEEEVFLNPAKIEEIYQKRLEKLEETRLKMIDEEFILQ